MSFKVKLLSSLAKVMLCEEPADVLQKDWALAGQIYSFQAAYCSDEQWSDIEICVDSALAEFISVRQVLPVPVDHLPAELDDDVLIKAPGLVPDLLAPLWQNKVMTVAGQWRSLWIKISLPADAEAGVFPVKLTFTRISPEGKRKVVSSKTFTLEVLPHRLPEQKLMVTHWFHSDCLAAYYRNEVFSEEYWTLCRNFIGNAVAHGMNMLLTPIFTPPLDTQVGGERPTVQLVKVFQENGKWRFDFSLLERWIALGRECGIKYFEMAHLFTQWGAGFTPKIMAETPEGYRRIFGWDVPADSPEYRDFLGAFLPELAKFFRERNMVDQVIFHCSDEPRRHHFKSYKYAAALLREFLGGFKIVDALSLVDIFKEGFVDIPVVCEFDYDHFAGLDLPEKWIYYCCEPFSKYPNRFMYQPSVRNRSFGALLYKYGIDGFLHWGFNFYYSRNSRFKVDPFGNTTCGGAFPAGDAYLVYPGDDGMPMDSIRHEVFFEALQDQRLMECVEAVAGREKLLKALDAAAPGRKLDLLNYPDTERRFRRMRAAIRKLLD